MTKEKIQFNRETLEFEGLTEEIKKQVMQLYPHLDLENELTRMKGWLLSKGKARKGTYAFILNWLGNAQPKEQKAPNVLDSSYTAYLKELWRNREHILEINSR